MTAEPCPVCHELKHRNDEDILPRWARGHALRLFPLRIGQQYPRRIKLRICRDCNDLMASRFEDHVAPLITRMMEGNPVSLNAQQQEDVSGWVIKTTLLMGLKEEVAKGRPNEPARLALLPLITAGVIPPGSSVRIAEFPAGEDAPPDETADLAQLLPGGPPMPLHFFGVNTLARVAFEVILGEPSAVSRFIQRTPDTDRLRRIWPPPSGEVPLPPPHVLTRGDVAALRTALRAVVSGPFVRHAAGPNLP
jgi:hypothetical protein